MSKLSEKLSGVFRAPVLTRRRVWLAFVVAVVADGLQFLFASLGPIGWFLDEVIDVIAMILASGLLGFHFLFLPTFVVEFVPVVDMLPTWTACVSAVVLLRRRGQHGSVELPPALPPPPLDKR